MSDNEQYRAGFEAWFLTKAGNDADWLLTRFDNGQYKNLVIREKFETWTAAKRDVSTEPIGYISRVALAELQDTFNNDNHLTILHSKSSNRRAEVPVFLTVGGLKEKE